MSSHHDHADIERRLRAHMAEQAQQLSYPASDPDHLVDRRSGGAHRLVGTLAAVVVVLAAGVGFWALSRDGGATEIAAGETDNADETSPDVGADDGDQTDGEQTDGAPADGGQADGFITLDVVDVTDANSPGSGWSEVAFDGGIYYVLSTAPGRVSFDDIRTEEEWARLTRPRTFYTLGEDGGWELGHVGDRFVSDFDVEDGVLYVVSTGSATGDTGVSLGTSSDRGRSWEWRPLDLPEANQVAMLRGEASSVIVASRWGHPDHDEVLRLAGQAGVDMAAGDLRHFDADGFSYWPVDRSGRCSAIYADYGLLEWLSWIRELPEEERAAADEEIDFLLVELGPELEAQGCAVDAAAIRSIELPEVVTWTWAELGIEVPERWTPWSGVYRYENGQLTELANPFDGQQVSVANVWDGRLRVNTVELGNEVTGETWWTTSNGVDWDRRTVSFEEMEEGVGDLQLFYDPSHRAPVAGQVAFRMAWPTEGDQVELEMQADGTAVGDGDAIVELEMTDEMFVGHLERSVAGGPWERVDPTELAPDLGPDLGDAHLQDLRGTSYGVFLIYAPAHPFDGPPDDGLIVLYSNNGVDWASFETSGAWLELHDTGTTLLAFDHRTSDGAEVPPSTRTLLLTPVG